MGKNFEDEMAAVPETLRWVAKLDVSDWSFYQRRICVGPLVVVASGGSLSAAHFLARLHTSTTGHPASVLTPLELIGDEGRIDAAILLISASGSNSDILRALDAAKSRGCRELGVFCGTTGSELVRRAQGMRSRCILSFDLPAGRDGFLATNSLVAFFCIALRLYGCSLPRQPEAFSEPGSLLERETIIVLYGGWLGAVAIDIESRFTEAALGNVQIADFRNFAHGRHHWLAKRGSRTHVLALVSPRCRELAAQTLACFPPEVSTSTWHVADDAPERVVELLIRAMHLAGKAAKRLGYDAGRPGVPEFGERIYELKAAVVPALQSESRQLAVDRKARSGAGLGPEQRELLNQGCDRFEKSLVDTTFVGVVFDYDGTLVTTERKLDPIQPELAQALNRLAKEGLVLGFATGRGKSVHEMLRSAIHQAHWPRCWIGYYNGGAIRTLAEGHEGIASGEATATIKAAAQILEASRRLPGVTLDTRPRQITVASKSIDELELWRTVREVLDVAGLAGLKVVRSSHSVDVLDGAVSKANFVRRLAETIGSVESAFLKIGDRGQWPGNDAELLAMSHGLSVDEVSSDTDSCWNLLPSLSGPAATCAYLEQLQHGRYVPAKGGSNG